jgi:CheY-like chemotaxis protein
MSHWARWFDRKPRPAGGQAAGAAAETILVVDDEPAVRELLQELLQTAGYTVFAAADGERALAFCRGHPGRIDLVLVDVVMPRMAGPQLVLALSLARPATRFLYISGYGQDAIPTFDRTTPFLAKPIAAKRLLQAVSDALGPQRARPPGGR